MPDSGDPAFLAADETRLTRLACHVGHQYGPQTLHAVQLQTAETNWAAVAALEEHAALARHLAGHSSSQDTDTAASYQQAADTPADIADSVRSYLSSPST